MNKITIGIIGLGYVGLPLALSFVKKKIEVIGFDIDKKKIKNLKIGIDSTNEVENYGSKYLNNIFFTSDINDLKLCNIFIVTVPTPVDKSNKPDLRNIIDATNLLVKCVKPSDTIIYESTVYPGVTRNICGGIIEKKTKLFLATDENLNNNYKNLFYLGYSPERINPGDSKHKLQNVTKLVSASCNFSLSKIKKLYKKICTKVYCCKTIEIAESAKVIENTQRDLNIALVNEFQIIFDNLNINVHDVLAAARTKWNFLDFKPGLVGGHCIGVDPYYLTYKSTISGYRPKLILSGRKINNFMPQYLYKKISNSIKKKFKKKITILFLGISFKENCNDVRNSKNLKLYILFKKKYHVDVFDPIADTISIKKNYKKINLINKIKKKYDVVILSVPHNVFINKGIKKIKSYLKKSGLLFDIKNAFGLSNFLNSNEN
jgi:UDP-N-acetyl-D-galactosamine dehydrogenase